MQISLVVGVQHFYGKSKSEESKPPQQPSDPLKRWSHLWPLVKECESDKLQLTCDFVLTDLLSTTLPGERDILFKDFKTIRREHRSGGGYFLIWAI